MSNLYSKELIEHYKNPKRFSKMENPDLTGVAVNSLCGDELTLYVKNDNGTVVDVSFQGSGCAICLGTMSMFIDSFIDKNIRDLFKLSENEVLERISMDSDSPRKRCATLTLEAIQKLK
ncbi:MAG TPA: iron-sulfur cluster assembly scaffold protein [Candidatus Dojkabacteria bacterium]|nr:iron-sulfur cluster assembly scaffold protein [Candidatus Dojkabacteria bacterium]